MLDKHVIEPIKIGERHLVPCVRTKGLEWTTRGQWLPILGPLHDDIEFLNFAVEHFHIDFRFVDPISFASACDRYASCGQEGLLLGLVIGKAQVTEGPMSRDLICYRSMPIFPTRSRAGETLPYICALEDVYAEWTIDPTLAICPHRGIPLRGLANERGIAVCPGHGLAWDMQTGRCVRRFSQPDDA